MGRPSWGGWGWAIVVLGSLGCSELATDLAAGERCVRSTQCEPGLACVGGMCTSDLSAVEGSPPMFGPGPDAAVDASLDGAPLEDTAVPPMDTGTPPMDTGTPPMDTGTPPTDTGTPPRDTGTPPLDTGTPPLDTGTPPMDTGTPPTDAGGPAGDAGRG